MAKTVNNKKKRIAHNQMLHHEMPPGTGDILSNIMKEMDNLSSGSLNILPNKTVCLKNVQNTATPSNGQVTAPKPKKFGTSRSGTFPLMQKCQKDLKQLKHNREMPKPMAHLAGITNEASHNNKSLPTEKSKKNKVVEKKIEKLKAKNIEKCIEKLKTKNLEKKNEKSKAKNVENKFEKSQNKAINKLVITTSHGGETSHECTVKSYSVERSKNSYKMHQPEISKNNSSVEEFSDVEHNSHKKIANDSSDTSDFENFIHKEKELIKYSSTQKKQTKKEKFQSKPRKRGLKKISTESDCESSCDGKEKSQSQPRKRGLKKISSESDCESSGDGKEKLQSTPKKRGLKKISSESNSESSSDEATKPYHKNKKRLKTTPKLTKQCRVSIEEKSESEADMYEIYDETFHDSESDASKNDSISDPQEEDFNKSLVIDLAENPQGIPYLGQADSHNSVDDFNMLDERADLHKHLHKHCEPVYWTGIHQQQAESKDNMKNLVLDNDVRPSNLQKPLPLNKLKEETSDDCEIIFDDVCNSNSSQNLSNVSTFRNTGITDEKDSTKIGTKSHFGSDVTIKDNELTQIKPKLEVAHSNLRNLITAMSDKDFLENEGSVENGEDVKTCFQNLTKEFETYQTIIETASTFKLLERRQGENLVNLLLQISKLIESSSSDDLENAIDDATSASSAALVETKTLEDKDLVPVPSISENDVKPHLSELQSTVKQEQSSSDETNTMSFDEKCIVCAKDALAACQQCLKVFFCSNECGMQYWEAGHKNTCVK